MAKKQTKKTKPEFVTENDTTSPVREMELVDKESEIAEIPNTPMMPAEVTPMVMMQMAIQEGSDVATMERLWALNEKVGAANAKKSYDLAMSQFKQNPPKITKDKHVSFNDTSYDHASLGNVVEQIGARLGEYGLSHHWDIEQGEKIKVTCILTHSQGHNERVSLEAASDTSGSIKGIQSIASTISYLQRYTLLSATGLATQDMDDDGRTADVVQAELLPEEELNELHSMLVEHEINMKTFNAWLLKDTGFEGLDAVTTAYSSRVRAAINASIKGKNKEKK